MQYRKLGTSGIEVSVVGFGAWAIGGWMWGGTEEQQALAAIGEAIDAGITLLDTAPIYGYGRSEELIGRAIRGRRDKIVLATKCGMVWDREEGEFFFHADDKGMRPGPSEKKVYKSLKPESIRNEVEASLRRLGTEHIDLLQTHWQEATTPIADTVACLKKLQEEGKIRTFGVSNCTLDHLKAYGPVASDQEKYSMLDRGIETNGMLDFCRQHDVAVLAYSPLANGLLTGKMQPGRKFGEGDLRRTNMRFAKANVLKINGMLRQIEPIAQKHEATIANLVIAWTVAQPGITCALCGARDAGQSRENARAGDLRLSAEELQTINEALGRLNVE